MTIFKNRIAILTELRQDRLAMAAATLLPGVEVSDDFLYSKLLEAEASIARHLRVYLEPTIMVPDDAPQAELDALAASGKPWAQEAATDYTSNLFTGDRWGYIVAQHKPIISVQSVRFVYPSALQQVFEVPADWIRLDRRAGHVRMVPSSQAFTAPFGVFLMQAMTGGRTVPNMVQLRYTTGFENVMRDWPELVGAIKKSAVLGLIKDAFLPQSGSISADGLSQSLSVDMDHYDDAISRVLDGEKGSNGGLMTAIHGVRLGVL